MKSFVVLIFLVALTLASVVREDRYSETLQSSFQRKPLNPRRNYHRSVGMPLAKSIKQFEQDMKLKISDNELNERIIGGSLNPVGVSPYMGGVIVIFDDAESICGSSLLSHTRSITAAHCWKDDEDQAKEFELVHGSSTLYSGGVRTKTKNVTMHEDWDHNINANDIAMIYHSSVAYTDVISPIALPPTELEDNDFHDMWAQAVGYGMNSSNSDEAQPQRIVSLQVITTTECETSGFLVWDAMICTRSPQGLPVGICGGDSGGPLSTTINGTRYLIGIAAFSGELCEEGPSVFSRVTWFKQWITDRL